MTKRASRPSKQMLPFERQQGAVLRPMHCNIHDREDANPLVPLTFVERSAGAIPGGVNSPSRSFVRVGGSHTILDSGRGATICDVAGRTYIDYIGSWGAAILGHGHPAIVAAVTRVAKRGTSFGLTCADEIRLAEALRSRMKGIEKLRVVNSGSEAVMSAIRLARIATGRELIVKFSGCYHGHVDGLIDAASLRGDRVAGPRGKERLAVRDKRTLVLEYNDLNEARACFETHGKWIAAVIVEPIAANMGVVPPAAGFLELLRRLTSEHRAILVFDEVVTGIRLGPGGAQQILGVRPDLTVLGKALGGGLPIGAYGGRADLMDCLAPLGNVYQGGTFSGNPLTCAAALATLAVLDESRYEALDAAGARLAEGLIQALFETDTPGLVQRVGSMLSVFLGVSKVTNYREAQQCNIKLFARFFHAMLRRGIHLPPSQFEAWFLSTKHAERVIQSTVRKAKDALSECKERGAAC